MKMINTELIEEQDDSIFVRIDKLSKKSSGKNIAISVSNLITAMHPLSNSINEISIEECKRKLQEELDNLEIDEFDLDPYLRTQHKIDFSCECQVENQFIKDLVRTFDYQRQYQSAKKRLMYLSKIIYSMNAPEIEVENNDINEDENDRLYPDE